MINFKKYNIIIYLVITFILTWIFWIIGFTSSSTSLNGLFHITGSFVPSIVAIILTGYNYGVDGIKKLFKKLILWKVNPVFYAFVFLYTAMSIYIPSFICNILGSYYNILINNHIGPFQLTSPLTILLCFLAIIIFGGPLGEELGWRGYVLPKLQNKFNPLISSIILGTIWSSWHIPMFYFHVTGYDINFIVYLLETIWLTIIFTWLYNKTKGSLLIIILFHSVDNFIMGICFNDFMIKFNIYSIIFWSVKFILLLCIAFDMTRKPLKHVVVK